MLREGMFIADRYEVIDKIGSGGMSEVYKAMDHKLNRYVAMKVLKSDYSEDKTFVTKFRAEAQSAAGLMHSNIVNVYDVGEEDGLHYIVMELVEGITLKKYIERKGHLGTREAISIAIQVAQGIEAAHKHHIVHRDIKPQNIIISKEGKVKVTDFGIARAATSNTINSAVMGSVHYISPEQARGGYSDEKSDIYSFGITLFEMLTGRVPFEGDSTVSVALKHIQDDMVSPKTIIADLPISVEKIVLKCTQKKTERRYQSISDLIVDLKRSLVTPDEDFVIISTAIPADGATHIIGEEDLIEISQRAANKTTASDVSENGLLYQDDEIEDLDATNANAEENLSDNDDLEGEEEPDDEFDDLDDDDDDEIKPKKTLDLIITIAGIILAVGILIVTYLVITKLIGNSDSGKVTPHETVEQTTEAQTVPNLSGKTYDEAKEILKGMGLGIAKNVEYSDDYDKDLIFDQSPKAGEPFKLNSTVTVTISLGPTKKELENVLGKTQEDAEAILKEQGVVVDYQYEETDNEKLIGTVAQTKPIQGTEISKGDKVTLIIYIGTSVKNVVVPDIVGLKESVARKKIEDLKLVVDKVTEVYDDEVAEGLVISQSGATAEKEAPEGTKISFVVSLGVEPTTEETTTAAPEPVKVVTPSVVGKSEKVAKSEITSAKLKVGTVEKQNSDTVAAGLVISQSVEGGSAVEENTTVNLVVSLGKKIVTYTITASVDSSYISSVVTDENATLTCKFVLHYTDGQGNESTKQLAGTSYANKADMLSKAPFNVSSSGVAEFTDSNFDANAGATIIVTVIQKNTGTEEENTFYSAAKEATISTN